MKPIALLTVILSLQFSTVTFGQIRTYYHKHTFDKTKTFTKCENPPTFGTDSLDLQKYLAEKLQNQVSVTEGKIKISVLVDTTGKAWCKWIENHSNLDMKKDKLNLLVDSMPNWNCGIQNGYKVIE